MSHHHSGCCGCHLDTSMKRRTFLAGIGGSAVGATLSAPAAAKAAAAPGERPKPSLEKKPITVQPALVYNIYKYREATSWRPWGGLKTEADVEQEVNRIDGELKDLVKKAEFPIDIRPLAHVRSKEEAAPVRDGDADVLLIYGASGDLQSLMSTNHHNIVFVRHKSGPVYLWYEIVHPRLLRKTIDEYGEPGLTPYDVVVDEMGDVLWRLRSLYALKNTVGSKMICVGGASGWGVGGRQAPEIARNLWKMDLIDAPYEDLGKRIQAARKDPERVRQAEADAAAYLKLPKTHLETDAGFVSRAFLLTQVFEEIMAEAGAQAMTINSCMGTIMPMSETTACLPLSLINDSGALAFCESDFAVIPSGVLMHHIASTPVFLQDPTYPHHGVVTVAHCTAPRKMDGKHLEEAYIQTHFESDYGAAPKVNLKLGQTITMIDPDFGDKRWIGFRGKVVDNPSLDICRAQSDIEIEGDCQKLMEDMRGFHWMLAYGDHLKEVGYALRKLGIGWYNLTDDKTVEA